MLWGQSRGNGEKASIRATPYASPARLDPATLAELSLDFSRFDDHPEIRWFL
jgi:hypothetical protein